MARGIKIANTGINALTDTNPKNFSLFVDGTTDHILVKEFDRDTVSVAAFTTHEITHSLGYIPIYMVGVDTTSGFQWLYGNLNSDGFRTWATTTKIFFRNAHASARNITYIIFYDQL